VIYNYNGQWSNYMNQFMHFWDDGLFVGQFGATVYGINFPANGPVAGLASNAFSPQMIEVNNTLYAFQSDEMVHSGVHRWRVDGTDTITEIAGSGALDSTIVMERNFPTELLTVAATSGLAQRIIPDLRFADGEGTILDATAVGNYVTYVVPNVAAGSYDVRVGVKAYNTRGIWQLAVGRADNFNGTKSNVGAPQDEFAASDTFTEYDLGTWAPGTTSDKWFQFMIVGKNAGSTGYSESFDYIRLIPR
jgi:hypothetical protein